MMQKISIVEDDIDIQDILKNHLMDAGYEVAPVIMLTALSDEENQLRGFEQQIDDYIPKPFSPKILLCKIAAILRKERKANQKIGEELLSEFLKKEEIRPEEAVVEKLRKLHNFKNEEELLAAIGSKAIILGETDKNELREKQTSNWKKYLTFSFGNSNKEKTEEKEPQEKEKINPKEILRLTEESLQKKYIMAECCPPIHGDDVLGYVDENDRIIIHKRQCPVAAKLKSSYGNRILATEWDTHKELSFLVYIYLRGIDSMGLLNEGTQVISRQLNVNIRKLAIETNDGIFEGKIQLWVHDVEDVKTICNNLKKIQNIKQVNRVEE